MNPDMREYTCIQIRVEEVDTASLTTVATTRDWFCLESQVERGRRPLKRSLGKPKSLLILLREVLAEKRLIRAS